MIIHVLCRYVSRSPVLTDLAFSSSVCVAIGMSLPLHFSPSFSWRLKVFAASPQHPLLRGQWPGHAVGWRSGVQKMLRTGRQLLIPQKDRIVNHNAAK